MSPRLSALLVFTTSGLVLVLEIAAGRLMAPYVGVSLESFTGIIGTVLAGIAVGAAIGGWLADRHEPRLLIGQALFYGGLLVWLSIPIVAGLGPGLGASPAEIVMLSASAFFAPAAVLSGVPPMVAKLRLASLESTGTVIGGLSAWSTFGALLGTFGTGFVLLAVAPIRAIILTIGAVLVLGGLLVLWRSRRRPDLVETGLAAITALMVLAVGSACDFETEYSCVRIVADDDRAGGRSLLLDRLRHAHVDLDDPTHLEIRYIRLIAGVIDASTTGAVDALHLGGGGLSIPRWLGASRPGSSHLVLEIDGELVDIVDRELGGDTIADVDVRVGDARLTIRDIADRSIDVVVGDAFGGDAVPWHLATTEFIAEVDRTLRPGGVYVMNLIDGGDSDLVRAELATLAETFEHLMLIVPDGPIPSGGVNQIAVASHTPIPRPSIESGDGRVVADEELWRSIDGVRPLTDDFAPTDQLRAR